MSSLSKKRGNGENEKGEEGACPSSGKERVSD